MIETVGELIKKNRNLNAKLGRILLRHECPKNYVCLTKTLDDVCDACQYGPTVLVECMYKDKNDCKFKYNVKGKSLCECEVRIMIQGLLPSP